MARGYTGVFTELDRHTNESPRGEANTEFQSTRRSYRIRFDQLATAIPQFLGYPTRTAPNTLSRYLPHQDPWFPKLVCTDLSWEPLGKCATQTTSYGKSNVYPEAIVHCVFTKPPYAVLDDATVTPFGERARYVEVNYKPEGSYLVLNAVSGSYLWAGGAAGSSQPGLGDQSNKNFTQGVSKLLGEVNLTAKWYQIPYDYAPFTALYNCLGRINKGPFALDPGPSSPYDYGGNEVLLLGANINRIVLSTGDFGWNFEYLFKVNPRKFNYFYNPKASDRTNFYQVTVQVPGTNYSIFYDPASQTLPDGAAAYDERDFSTLFKVE